MYGLKIGQLIANHSMRILTHPKWKVVELAAMEFCKGQTRRYASAPKITTTTIEPKRREVSLQPPILNYVPIGYGQPTGVTHPHLLKFKEVVPGQTLDEFKKRRLRMIVTLQLFSKTNAPSEGSGNVHRPHFLVVPAATRKYMSGKTAYRFRQDSNFYYLTGCLEPDAVLLLTIDEFTNLKATLFLRQENECLKMVKGARTTPEDAIKMFGVNDAYDISEFETIFRTRVQHEQPALWYDRSNFNHDHLSKRIIAIAQAWNINIRSPAFYLHVMRAKKSLSEQNLLRKSSQITSAAFNHVMQKSRVGMAENRLAAMVEYECRKCGVAYMAYPPMVGAGKNATVVQYSSNNQVTKPGDLVRMDAGSDYFGYASGISRTWPISGQYTEPQKLLYEVVLQVQKDVIASILKNGGETLSELQATMQRQMGKYLQELKIIPSGITDEDHINLAVRIYCPHPVAHYIGLDAHDTELMSPKMRLQSGNVFTVEPGIYINADCTDAPKEFRGIGIRIKDNILIDNENKIEVLTSSCVKERKDINNLREQPKKKMYN